MLHVSLSELDKTCCSTIDSTFNFYKRPEWFDREDVKEIIAGIDKTKVIKGEYLESPVFGAMSPDRLSTGCKATILLTVLHFKIYATRCGDNCAKYLLKAAENEDLTIVLHHVMNFEEPFNIMIDDSEKVVHTMEEFVNEFYKHRC